MLTIKNISKIVGNSFHIGKNTLAIAKIFDVYEWIDNRYEFIIQVHTPDGKIKQFSLNLNREKIPYPVVLKDCWELSYEEAPNQYKVDGISKEEMGDMGKVMGRIYNMMDRILN
jgi:hypothetical protein